MNCVFIQNIYEFLVQFLSIYWTKTNIFLSVFVFLWITLFWDLYLLYRQYKIYRSVRQVPQELRNVMDNETLSKARDYNIDKSRFWFVAIVYSHICTALVLWYDVIPLLWSISGALVVRLGFNANTDYLQTVLFVLIGWLASIIADLPISLYRTFVVEQRHGFNKQTIGFYAIDRLKKFVVMQISLPILLTAIYIIKTFGQYFPIYLWIFSLVVTLMLVTIYPDVIAPIFDSFTPLPDGQLKKNIEQLARSIDFPLKQIYVVEGSKRSSHSNAYFFGFYKNKRIVLFDTLFESFYRNESKSDNKSIAAKASSLSTKAHKRIGCSDDEIVAILAHELGHWYLNHALKYILIAQTIFFVYFTLYSVLYQNDILFKAFGFSEQKPIFIGIYLIFRFVFWPLNQILSFLLMCLSRHFEFGSDSFAKKLKRGPQQKSALIKLFRDNLSFPVDDCLYSGWNHTHPTLLHRLKALNAKND